MLKIKYLLAVILIFVVTSVVNAQAPEGYEYVVQADDWLSKIAEKELGYVLAYQDIADATNAKAAEDDSFAIIVDPNVIEVGQNLWIPVAGEGETSMASPLAPGNQLTEDQLKNAAYSGIYEEPVTLTNGLYEGEPFVEGGAARPSVQFIDSSTVYGDLNGDGVDDAASLLVENSGGSGVFTYVGVQLNEGGQPVDAGTVWVGDRTQIKSMGIENGQIVMEVVTQGPDDPQCCPTQKVRKTYAVQNGQVTEVGSEDVGTVSLDDLLGTNWILADFNFDQQPVLADTQITANFADGQISGSAGCNNYSASVGSDSGQNLTVGSAISTQMACPDPIMNQELQYLTALQAADQWSYLAGNLALTYQTLDGGLGTLVFLPAFTTQIEPVVTDESMESGAMDTMDAAPTQVNTYQPTAVPAESRDGSCFANAIGLGREDAWRCTVGNQIFDPCFEVGGEQSTVVCGANPITGDIGFALNLTEPLPAPDAGDISMPWLVQLAPDSQVCGLMTGTIPGVDDRVAPYGCPDGSNLFDDFQQGQVWMAEKAVFGLNDNGFFVEQSEMVPLSVVWY